MTFCRMKTTALTSTGDALTAEESEKSQKNSGRLWERAPAQEAHTHLSMKNNEKKVPNMRKMIMDRKLHL